MEVTVALKNPPSGATKWQMSVIDWDITQIMSWGTKEQDNIGESAIFDIPPQWSFPLRIILSIYQKLNDTSRQLYLVQSYRTTKPFTGEPDPTYKEIFIPEYGNYYYNVATERFEIAPEEGPYSSISITAPSSAEEGERVSVSTRVTNVSDYDLEFRVELLAVRDIYAVPTPEERIGSLEVVIRSGQTQVISGTFIMPAWDTTFLVKVYRFIDYWDFDTYATKVVSLEIPVPEFAGTIVRKELKYDGTGTIPVY